MNLADFDPPVEGARRSPVLRWRSGVGTQVDDWLSEEVPVALEFNGISQAVMLATPADLDDFALGFGLSEGILSTAADLYGCEVEATAQGLVVRLQVSARCIDGLKTRRRSLAGRTGCGICGTESLDQMLRTVRPVPPAGRLRAGAIAQAMRAMGERQRLNQATGSVHAAAWCDSDGAIRLLREDVGRHNALDKLVGALARSASPQGAGFIAVTSRASVEMVQKAAVAGAPWLAAVSAPTALAVETACAAGMGLAGLVRGDDLVVYANPQGLSFDERQD